MLLAALLVDVMLHHSRLGIARGMRRVIKLMSAMRRFSSCSGMIATGRKRPSAPTLADRPEADR